MSDFVALHQGSQRYLLVGVLVILLILYYFVFEPMVTDSGACNTLTLSTWLDRPLAWRANGGELEDLYLFTDCSVLSLLDTR